MCLSGTLTWMRLLPEETRLGDAFYFAVTTFLTIGYGDIHPESAAARAFFIVYISVSLVVQLTVLASFVNASLSIKLGATATPSIKVLLTKLHTVSVSMT